MIHRAHTLSSTTDAFNEECDRLRAIFVRLQYPVSYVNSAISSFVRDISSDVKDQRVKYSCVIRVILPFKDQTANAVKRQMRDLSQKIGPTVQPIFVNKKLEQDVKPKEVKPLESHQSLINSAWSIYFHVICVIRIMTGILPDTFTNALLSIRTQRLVNTFWRPTGAHVTQMKTSFGSYANAAQSSNALCTRC